MTKKITTSKRDREKLKEQKRKEKQKRKEERQNSGTNSFEEMIAYVDENGQFHETPPEKSKEIVDAAEIAVSTPKQEDVQEEALQGLVSYFNDSKGYGFIKEKDGLEKYFFHITSAPSDIKEGDKVTFETERGPQGMNAVRISIIKNQ